MTKKIFIHYTSFEKELASPVLDEYLVLLPADQRIRNAQYQRWQDRQAHLFGRLLLLEGWKQLGKGNALNRIKYNSWMRPFIPGSADFNISHAGNYVLCAMDEGCKLGVDIELCQDIDLSDYQSTMNEAQWADIYGSPYPMRTFFRYWAMKEAVVKADGQGLSIPLDSIVFNVGHDFIQVGDWFLYELKIDANYQAWLACDRRAVEACLIKYVF